MASEEKQLTPSYLGIAWLEKMVALLSKKTHDHVDTTLFLANGFSKVDAQLAVSTLRFAGFIDENGKATENMAALRFEGEARKTKLKPVVEKAYEPLFSRVDDPQHASNIDLKNSFRAVYPKLSDRVIRSAIPVFFKWCEYGGLKEEGSVRSWTQKGGSARKQTNPKQKQTERRTTLQFTPNKPFQKVASDIFGDSHIQPVTKNKEVGIFIPEEWNINTPLDEGVAALWLAAIKALNTYVKSYEAKYGVSESDEMENMESSA